MKPYQRAVRSPSRPRGKWHLLTSDLRTSVRRTMTNPLAHQTHQALCRFTGTADDLGTWSTWDIDGAPALLCETHQEPAEGDVYDTGIGVCTPTAKYIRDHSDHWTDGTTTDTTLCRCGRPAATCHGRADVAEILTHIAYQRTHYGLWDVRLADTTDTDSPYWPVRAYGATPEEAISNARVRLADQIGDTAADALIATATRQIPVPA